jgi:hypothetical protein
MYLAAVVRLMVEEMADCHGRRLHVMPARIVDIGKRPIQKGGIHPYKERFDQRVLLGSGGAQTREFVEQHGTQVQRGAAGALKPRHPYPIAQ